ncbi:MAG: hypothetical protein AAFY78_18675 [Cyanobacteria bacterium J06648_16]
MTIAAPGQMTWRPPGTTETVLHLRRSADKPWQVYTEFPDLVQEDPPEFSAGYATFIALVKAGWEVVPV